METNNNDENSISNNEIPKDVTEEVKTNIEPTSFELEETLSQVNNQDKEKVLDSTTNDNVNHEDKTNDINFEVKMNYTTSVENKKTDVELLSMPTSSLDDITNVINGLNSNLDKSKEEWLNVVVAGAQYATFDDGLLETTRDKLASFTQLIDSTAGQLGIVNPKFKTKQNTTYTGEAALMRVRSSLGMGTAISIPLWHSGFWITIKTPRDGAILDLYRRLSSDKVKLGRASYGLLLSNTTVYTTKTITDFIFENIYSTSLAIKDVSELRSHIKIQDIPVLIWGLACAIWHKGFHYNRACISDPNVCTHVISELIDLKKIHWTNKKVLSEKQIAHMTKREQGTMSLQDIENYQFDFPNQGNKLITLNEDIKLMIRTPSLEDHIKSGDEWISSIEERFPEALILKQDERDDFLFNQAKASSIRQYSHFIKEVILKEDKYTEQDFINDVLDDISGDDYQRDLIIRECTKYIDETTMSLIAIPTYKCPNCGEEQSPNKDINMFSSLIPLDAMNVFFILLVQKIQLIETR